MIQKQFGKVGQILCIDPGLLSIYFKYRYIELGIEVDLVARRMKQSTNILVISQIMFRGIKRQTKITNMQSSIYMIPLWKRRKIPSLHIIRTNLDIRYCLDFGMFFMSLLIFLLQSLILRFLNFFQHLIVNLSINFISQSILL